MTMLRGIKKEDNLIMIMECIIYDNRYLEFATIENKTALINSLNTVKEEVNALNSIRIDRAIKIIRKSIIKDMTEDIK